MLPALVRLGEWRWRGRDVGARRGHGTVDTWFGSAIDGNGTTEGGQAMSGSQAGAATAGRWRPAARLTVLLDEDDKWRHTPLYHEVVRRARETGLAGASVWRGIEGYGASAQVHTTRLLDVAVHLPLMLVVVDEPERLRAFVERNAELFTSVNVTLAQVDQWQEGER